MDLNLSLIEYKFIKILKHMYLEVEKLIHISSLAIWELQFHSQQVSNILAYSSVILRT